MNRQELEALKTRVLNDITPLAMESNDTVDRFGLLLRVIQAGGASRDIYSQAYESANQIQNKDERLNSLLALLDELDFDENLIDNGKQPAPATATPQQAPEQDTEAQG